MRKFLIISTMVMSAVLVLAIISASSLKKADEVLESTQRIFEKRTIRYEKTEKVSESEPTTVEVETTETGIYGNDTGISDWEYTLLIYMVHGEVGMCDYDDWWACYCQCATAINRVKTGWGSSIGDVIYQEGQYETWWYESLMWWDFPDDTTIDAVNQCLSDWASQTPETLVYADSRDTIPDGCYIYYETPCDTGTWQRFYAY